MSPCTSCTLHCTRLTQAPLHLLFSELILSMDNNLRPSLPQLACESCRRWVDFPEHSLIPSHLSCYAYPSRQTQVEVVRSRDQRGIQKSRRLLTHCFSDKKQPRCGTCARLSQQCVFPVERLKPGPKDGTYVVVPCCFLKGF